MIKGNSKVINKKMIIGSLIFLSVIVGFVILIVSLNKRTPASTLASDPTKSWGIVADNSSCVENNNQIKCTNNTTNQIIIFDKCTKNEDCDSKICSNNNVCATATNSQNLYWQCDSSDECNKDATPNIQCKDHMCMPPDNSVESSKYCKMDYNCKSNICSNSKCSPPSSTGG